MNDDTAPIASLSSDDSIASPSRKATEEHVTDSKDTRVSQTSMTNTSHAMQTAMQSTASFLTPCMALSAAALTFEGHGFTAGILAWVGYTGYALATNKESAEAFYSARLANITLSLCLLVWVGFGMFSLMRTQNLWDWSAFSPAYRQQAAIFGEHFMNITACITVFASLCSALNAYGENSE